MDFGGLTRYGSDNADSPEAWRERVVFLGDDITELGNRPAKFFPGTALSQPRHYPPNNLRCWFVSART